MKLLVNMATNALSTGDATINIALLNAPFIPSPKNGEFAMPYIIFGIISMKVLYATTSGNADAILEDSLATRPGTIFNKLDPPNPPLKSELKNSAV